MNGVQTRLKCKPNVKQCKRLVFPARSALFNHNILNTKAISHFQANHILIRFVFPPLQSIDFTALFYRDGISGSFDTPTGVTHVLEVPGYGCSLSVDLQRRIIVIGDSQHTNTWTPTYSALASTTDNKYYGRGILWASLWAIIYNTAQYGDHFTDALK